MMGQIGGQVIVVAPNRLGAINHVLLSVRALEPLWLDSLRVVLMGMKRRDDAASKTNLGALVGRLTCSVVSLPYLGRNACELKRLRANSKFLEKTLAGLLPSDSVSALLKAVG
jgi:dethiobiotin synthetase